MEIFWTILKIFIFTGIVTVLGKQTYNWVFFIGRKPMLWVLIMMLLNFCFFLIGSNIQSSFNAVWWSSVLAFFALLPPKNSGDNSDDIKKAVEDVYTEMSISNGVLKYRLGLIAYVIGGIIGWVVFYGKIIALD